MLLNDAAPPQRPQPGPSLSRILHTGSSLLDDKLAVSAPLRRQPHHQYALPEELSPSPSRIFPDSPRSRPSSSSSHAPPPSTVSPLMPSKKPSSVPYNPKKSITPPSSVLIPLSPEEMQMYKKYCSQGAARLRKRNRGADDDEDDVVPAKRHAGNVGLIVSHYNSRPDVSVIQRLESPIISLKNFNNWVESVLITRFAHPALLKSGYSQGRLRGKVLDMGCGKGGDITKWAKAKVRELLGVGMLP